MSQFMRPSADINTGWAKSTGGSRYGCIDEASYSDSDYIRGSADSYQECRLSTPASTPADGTCTLRYRAMKSSTNITSFAMEVRQGATVIASLTTIPGSSMTAYTKTFSASSVTDWSDVRVRFTIDLTGFCSVDVSWVELEIPDPPIASGLEMGMMF
jgi:hypothetical protein